jgi:long-subunit fatty acid transport protein
VAVGFNQPWGSSNFSIRGGHFLNDLEFWNFNMFGDISWRVYKGLSVSFNARASIIRDERAVLKGDASLEDVLLQLRKLNSTYSYSFGFGLSYSFGSIYNNVVNPRFSSR